LPLTLAAIGVICLVVGSVYFTTSAVRKSRHKQFTFHVQRAEAAFNATNLVEARTQITQALKLRANDSEAVKLENTITQRIEAECSKVAELCRRELALGNLEGAQRFLSEVSMLQTNNPEALKLRAQIAEAVEARNKELTRLELEAKYQSALTAAEDAYGRNEFKLAFDKAVEALSYKPGEARASKLRNDADGQIKSALERETKYQAALKAAEDAYGRNEFKLAFDKAVEALSYKPGESRATRLTTDLGSKEKTRLELETKYQTALKAAEDAYGRNEFKLAFDKAVEALSY